MTVAGQTPASLMNTEQELRCCPFCGTSNKLKVTPYRADDDGGEPFDWGFTVICSALGFSHAPNRGCGASGAWGETEAEAIAAWNRRAPAVAAGGVTEARAIVDEMLARDKRNGFLTDWWRNKLDALDAALPAPPSRGEGE